MTTLAEQGFAGASIRKVAAAAGVSPGLIQYHFHTKGSLQAAVDDFVLERAAAVTGRIWDTGPRGPLEFSQRLNTALTTLATADPSLVAYLRRALVEDGPSAARLFDGLMSLARQALDRLTATGLLRGGLDTEWVCVQIILLNVGPLLLQPLIDRHLDPPLLSDVGLQRWQNANAVLGLRSILSESPADTGDGDGADSGCL